MKTDSYTVSRRSILGGSLVALVATPLAASTVTPRGDDGALLSMIQEWLKGRDQLDQLEAAYAVAEERYHGLKPEFPAAAFGSPGMPS